MNDGNSLNDSELFSSESEYYSFSERYFGISTKLLFFLLFIVVLFGIYISILLFGDNSINVLFDLEEYETYLSHEVVRLKTENAALQKEYFELLELNSH